MENDNHFDNLFTDDIYLLDFVKSESNDIKIVSNNKSVTIDEKEKKLDKIVIYTSNSISHENKDFLSKILQAVKINIDSDCIIKENCKKEEVDNNGKYFFFDDSVTNCAEKGKGIIAPSLQTISNNVDLKKSLWSSLQSIYL